VRWAPRDHGSPVFKDADRSTASLQLNDQALEGYDAGISVAVLID
jgi:hypothetical protein